MFRGSLLRILRGLFYTLIVVRCESDERRKGRSLLAIKMKARAVVGRGEKSLPSDLGSELRLLIGRENETIEIAKIIDGMK